MPNFSNKRKSTRVRHQLVVQKFDELMQPNEHNLRPDMDSVFARIEKEIGYSSDYIRTILKTA